MYLLLALLLIAGAGAVIEPIHRMRVEYDLSSDPVKGVSPELMLATTALGAFRGIIVDIVWIRLQDLKQSGRFFEIVQLSDWACKLAPRFPGIWAFHAWNMAFNISVEIPYLPERWSWVSSGIRLLRDEAIPANPQEPSLYNELARIYLVKVGGQLDDAHGLYKEELGRQMHEVLGGGGSREELQKFANAPRTRKELLREADVSSVRQKCLLLDFDPVEAGDFFEWIKRPDSVPQQVARILESPDNEAAVAKIEAFVRARRLREEFKLDPQRMIALVDRYGPFDWRSPYPHAIYWATLAREKAQGVKEHIIRRRKQFGVTPEDLAADLSERPEMIYRQINYDRVIYGAMQDLVRYGRLLYNSKGEIMPIVGPDYRFAEAMIRLYDEMLGKYGNSFYGEGVVSAYVYFLRRLAVESYYSGNQEAAVRYWKLLKDKFPNPQLDMPFTQFIELEMKSYMAKIGRADAGKLVRMSLIQALFWLGCNVTERAAALEGKARMLCERWNKNAETLRWTIPYERIRESVLMDIFSGRANFPPEVIENLTAQLGEARVNKYIAAAEELKKKTIQPEEIEEKYKTVKPSE